MILLTRNTGQKCIFIPIYIYDTDKSKKKFRDLKKNVTKSKICINDTT